MAELCKARKVVPVIDKRYPLNEVPKLSGTLEKDTSKAKS